ncbi:MAG: hypothetical protein HKN58_03860 [Xanthomonadales bacterium]|nr:hypothetical protein [Xanthomonadales bacterium]
MYAKSVFSLLLVAALATPVTNLHALEPYQQQALDRILASVDPAMRPMMQAQLQPVLAMMDQSQVESMLAGYLAEDSQGQVVEEAWAESGSASPEDLAFNQAQYEPVIRSAWQAQHEFDVAVTAELDRACGTGREFAVFGSAWRYEVYPLTPNWPRASNSADLDVQIIGQSYAPSDGRYQFDFSSVKTNFDRPAVVNAINSACAEYRTIGETFVRDANQRVNAGLLEQLPGLEGAANLEAGHVRAALEETLKAHAPSADGALLTALLNAEN